VLLVVWPNRNGLPSAAAAAAAQIPASSTSPKATQLNSQPAKCKMYCYIRNSILLLFMAGPQTGSVASMQMQQAQSTVSAALACVLILQQLRADNTAHWKIAEFVT
jgi:hypothetical protein